MANENYKSLIFNDEYNNFKKILIKKDDYYHFLEKTFEDVKEVNTEKWKIYICKNKKIYEIYDSNWNQFKTDS